MSKTSPATSESGWETKGIRGPLGLEERRRRRGIEEVREDLHDGGSERRQASASVFAY